MLLAVDNPLRFAPCTMPNEPTVLLQMFLGLGPDVSVMSSSHPKA